MLPDVQHLMELQQADREILRLNQEVAALPKRVAAIEEKLAGTKAVLEKAKAAVKADEATKRKYESAIQDQQGKISKYRDQSLAVKTNEQYKALLHEIQFAEQDIKYTIIPMRDLFICSTGRWHIRKSIRGESWGVWRHFYWALSKHGMGEGRSVLNRRHRAGLNIGLGWRR